MIKKILPCFLIIIIWAFFALPFIIRDETPFPAKYQNAFFAPWSAYPELGGPVKNHAMPDVIGQIYPWRHFTINAWKSGIVPLWNPYSFSGTPHLANYQSAVFSPLNIGFLIFPFVDWWTILIVSQPLLAGLFTYFYIRSLKLKPIPAIISSLSFMFCGFITVWMDYGTLAYAILYLPLALYSLEKYFETFRSRYLLLLTLTIPLSFFSGHFQISIYFLLFTAVYLLFRTFTQKDSLNKGIFAFLSILCGIFISCIQLFPSIELYSQSFRSTIFTKTEVIPWGYLPTFMAPDFFGNPVTGNDWFGHYAEWNAYIGLLALFFAIYSLFGKLNKYIFFFFAACLLSLLLAFPSPLLDLLVYLKIPVLSTSALSRIIVLFSFGACVLAAFGVERFLIDIRKKYYKKIIICTGIFTAAFVALWAIVILKLFLPIDKIAIVSSNLRLPSALFAAFVITLTGFYIFKKKKMQLLLCLVLIALVSIDMLRFIYKWQSNDDKSRVFAATPVSKFFPRIQNENRSFGNLGAEGLMYYNLLGTEGYDAVYIRRYGQFIAALNDGKLSDSFRSVVSYPKTGKYTLLGMNFLGGKYIIHKISDGRNIWEFPFWKFDPSSIKLLYDDEKYQVFENTNAYPRAFLVNQVATQTNPQKILDKMFDKNTDLKYTAVVEQDTHNGHLSNGSAEITRYQPNGVSIKTQSNGPSFLVLTDSFYSGWNAYVDGKQVKIYRTDFAFRGLEVPAGQHLVEFKYEPASFRYGIYTAIIGVLGTVFLGYINKKRNGLKL